MFVSGSPREVPARNANERRKEMERDTMLKLKGLQGWRHMQRRLN